MGLYQYSGLRRRSLLKLIGPGLSGWLSGKESAAKAADVSSIPRLGRSPGEGSDNPLQYSCLGNPMDRGTWQTTVHRVTEEMDSI